eukprot:4605470-Prymnesium_polylepis.2
MAAAASHRPINLDRQLEQLRGGSPVHAGHVGMEPTGHPCAHTARQVEPCRRARALPVAVHAIGQTAACTRSEASSDR